MRTPMQLLIALPLIGSAALSARAAAGFTPPGPNVALGKSYTVEPKPNYSLCTDDGDFVQLTDGVRAPETGSIWFHKPCVGWYYPKPAAFITLDLEEDTPIAGVAVSTEAGGAGVTWPSALLIAVSQDGEQYEIVGELMHLSSKHGVRPPAGRHVFATDDLRCHGRFVRLIVPAARYVFTDEIEVYRGPDVLLKQPFGGQRLDDITAYLAANQVPMAIRRWVARDIFLAREELAASGAPEGVRSNLADAITRIAAENSRLASPPGDDYRSVFPLTPAHGRLFKALGHLREAGGRPRLKVWKSNRWRRLSLWDTPPAGQAARDVALRVRVIRGERRADTVNIANNSREPVSARVWLEGLPGGATPGYVSVRQAEYVALNSGRWDADALPEATLEEGRWEVDLPAGVSRQLWFAFHPGPGVEPGTYQGAVIVDAGGGEVLRVPLTLTLEALQYPAEHTLAFGMWDYAYGKGSYGLNASNLPAAVAHMRSHGYNVPWSRIFPWVTAEDFDDQDRLVKRPDMSNFDEWVSMWPDARYYAVFLGGWTVKADNYAGVEIGSEKFTRRVAASMRFWADHVRGLGIDPRRLLILTVDEPRAGHGRGAERSVLWARTIKAAVPEFTLFVDPTDRQPQSTGLREMYEAHDVLCPHISHYSEDGQGARDFYEELRAGGRQLWLYNTAGGPSSLDATRHHRGQQWKLWLAQGTGTHFWAYADTGGSPGGSWNQFAAAGEIYSKVYIDRTSITDGKHWLAIIEGIQDYEYLRMLRDRVAELGAAGRKGPVLDRARELLKTLPAESVEAADGGDIKAYDRARLEVLDALVALR